MAKVQRETLLKSIVSTDVYQWKQGKVLRRCTAGAIVLTCVLASQALYYSVLYDNYSQATAYTVLGVMNAIGAWVAFRVINYPPFADFLIDVESEMAKVTWPTWSELQRATVVVLVTMTLFSVLLFGYDIAWQKFLELTGVLRLAH